MLTVGGAGISFPLRAADFQFLPTALQQDTLPVTAACSGAGRKRKSAARSGKLMPAPPTVSIFLSIP